MNTVQKKSSFKISNFFFHGQRRALQLVHNISLVLYTGTQAEQFFVRDQASATVRTGFRLAMYNT